MENDFGKKRKIIKCERGQTKDEAELVYVGKSKIKGAGNGLFAKQDIKKGTKLGYYAGKYLNQMQYDKIKEENCSYVWQVNTNPNRYVDSRLCKKAILRYVNGAITKDQMKNVNVEPYTYNGKLYYRTIKNVKKGTEFLIDYGDYYW